MKTSGERRPPRIMFASAMEPFPSPRTSRPRLAASGTIVRSIIVTSEPAYKTLTLSAARAGRPPATASAAPVASTKSRRGNADLAAIDLYRLHDRSSRKRRQMSLDPRREFLHRHPTGNAVKKEIESFFIRCAHRQAVNLQEHLAGNPSDTLVAVDERLVLRK